LEPFTHAFSSLALARAGQKRLPRFGALMMVVSGVAPDLDYASYFGGASSFLRFHRALLHSFIGSGLMICLIAGVFSLLDRRLPPKKAAHAPTPLGFRAALAICAVGAAGHILFDLVSGIGVQLLWPFETHWYGRELVPNFDPWVLALLVAGLLLPLLFKLVNEEVTSGQKTRSGGRSAIVTLVLVVGYVALRAHLHGEAVDLVLSREYHGRVALTGYAFPQVSSPFTWRGVAVTDDTLEEVEVSPSRPEEFDSNSSFTRYKPQDSPALEVAEKSGAAARFLAYAQVPIASVRRMEADYRVDVRDARFPEGDEEPANIILRVDLASSFEIRRDELLFASSANR
jgi:membrane-bound metal-dependent hydrolase YbcI (DUF457 family)